jgi:PAS domain S-box-containing protein
MLLREIASDEEILAALNDQFPNFSDLASQVFLSMFTSSPIGVYVVENGKFKITNLHFQETTGYPHGELLGKDGLFLVVHGDKEEVRRRAIDMLKGKARAPYRFRIRTKSGDIRWIVGGMAPFEYEGRRAAIGYYMDITAQVRLRSALRDCVRRSKQMRTQLLALSTSPSDEETANR